MPANLPIQLNGDGYEPMELDATEPDDYPTELPIIDEVNLDLATYASHYQGLVRIYRLEFIADHCRSLREEALTMALDYIKGNTCNVKDYVRLSKKLQEVIRDRQPQTSTSSGQKTCSSLNHIQSTWSNNEAVSSDDQSSNIPSGGKTHPDSTWIDLKTKQAALKYGKLESDLKNYKAIYVKENLRRAQDDLGQHYLDCGDLESALNAYNRSREYASTNRSTINQYLNIIRVAILLKRWTAVSNHVLRAWSQPATEQQGSLNAVNQVNCAFALYELHQRNYAKAARLFLAINAEYFTANSGILAPIDIAVYGSICALATYDRKRLAEDVINSPLFKQFSELDPQLREAVAKFYESKYDSCLAILQEIKNNLLLDMYLAPHVERLYRMIRNKAIVQYFEPYSSACMSKMASSFRTSLPELEQEVTQLIYDGHIKGRIDSHQRILFAKQVDPRLQTFENAINLSKEWQRQTKALITRTAILNASLEVHSDTFDLEDQRADQR